MKRYQSITSVDQRIIYRKLIKFRKYQKTIFENVIYSRALTPVLRERLINNHSRIDNAISVIIESIKPNLNLNNMESVQINRSSLISDNSIIITCKPLQLKLLIAICERILGKSAKIYIIGTFALRINCDEIVAKHIKSLLAIKWPELLDYKGTWDEFVQKKLQ